MKKLLIIVVMVLLVILTGITITKGMTIGSFTIWGIKEIKESNNELDEQIQEATKLASTDYQKKIKDLNNTIKELQSKKQSYEDMVNVSTDGETYLANQSQDYKIEYLWVKIGNYAKTEGTEMTMEVVTSSSGGEDVYDLNFTATGSYIGIADFITDIEEDSDLGFQIENFKMTSSNDTLQATFTCKDIKIDGISNNTVSSTSNNTANNTVSNSSSDNTNTTSDDNTVE